jgi:hypothetical protein
LARLHEVSIPALEVAVSLTDMANAVIVRYTDPDGKKGTQTATNSGSIARFGRKELCLNLSTAYAAEATNRAGTVLAQLQEPPNKETVSVEPDGRRALRIELTFRGWAETLKWLTTSSSTTATAVTSTQVTSLISDLQQHERILRYHRRERRRDRLQRHAILRSRHHLF